MGKPTHNPSQRKRSRDKKRELDLLRPQLLLRCANCCEKCGRYRPFGLAPHHIIPRSHGGPNTMENLISLCQICHDAIRGIKSYDPS